MKKIQHQLTENTKLLQKVILRHGGKFLILRRDGDSSSRPLAWDLPGGNSEWPETLENIGGLHKKDASREVLEETGIEINPSKFSIGNLVSFRTFFEAQKQIFSVIVGWKIDLSNDFDEEIIKISDEHVDYKWITSDELEDYDFGGVKGEFIIEMIKNSR
jgi:8-oxo-dGTP pyrophosphatase MutT (NUDIX family)